MKPLKSHSEARKVAINDIAETLSGLQSDIEESVKLFGEEKYEGKKLADLTPTE